jgi:hypothetical protein
MGKKKGCWSGSRYRPWVPSPDHKKKKLSLRTWWKKKNLQYSIRRR